MQDITKLSRLWAFVAMSVCSVADAATSSPDAATAESWLFKLTPSYYDTTHQPGAEDVNLRANNGPHAMWVGYYHQDNIFEQVRTGYEYTAQLPYVQLVPSLQLATHGFAGGSINAQIGGACYALLGIGRTNTRDYYNLNFDPNDSVVYGVGTTELPKSNLSIFTVRDNRLHTGQVVNHLVWRITPSKRQRWTLDLSTKHGRASIDDENVSGNAVALTYDYGDVFVRLAVDKKVNFTVENQARISLGMRF